MPEVVILNVVKDPRICRCLLHLPPVLTEIPGPSSNIPNSRTVSAPAQTNLPDLVDIPQPQAIIASAEAKSSISKQDGELAEWLKAAVC
jgi:hypothetical protein